MVLGLEDRTCLALFLLTKRHPNRFDERLTKLMHIFYPSALHCGSPTSGKTMTLSSSALMEKSRLYACTRAVHTARRVRKSEGGSQVWRKRSLLGSSCLIPIVPGSKTFPASLTCCLLQGHRYGGWVGG